jgi:hypothetical protein
VIDDSRNTYSRIQKNGMTVERMTSGSKKLLPVAGSSKKTLSTKLINIGDDKENKKLRL